MLVESDWSGKVVICPECSKGVTVPEMSTGGATVNNNFAMPDGGEEKMLSAAEEKLLLAKLEAIRAECGIEDYPAWQKGLRSLLFAAIPCVIVLLVMLTTGAAANVVYIFIGCALVFMGIIWTFATFRNPV